jgi:hypothetical protein
MRGTQCLLLVVYTIEREAVQRCIMKIITLVRGTQGSHASPPLRLCHWARSIAISIISRSDSNIVTASGNLCDLHSFSLQRCIMKIITLVRWIFYIKIV